MSSGKRPERWRDRDTGRLAVGEFGAAGLGGAGWFAWRWSFTLGGISARPVTRYARCGEAHVAYQVVGEGPVDLVMMPGLSGSRFPTAGSSGSWLPSRG